MIIIINNKKINIIFEKRLIKKKNISYRLIPKAYIKMTEAKVIFNFEEIDVTIQCSKKEK